MNNERISSIRPEKRHIRVAIPLLREYENIAGLIAMLHAQTFTHFHVYFCINQPDYWWNDKDKMESCLDNRKTFEYIREKAPFAFTVIDKFSKGKGWDEKKKGVGWARKILYEKILTDANEDDIIISLDADTGFYPGYFQAVKDAFERNPGAFALAVPYYHPLTGNTAPDRAILRYEIYLRTYLIGLFSIRSPYAFTAIGSAMAFPVWAYRKIGGMKAYESGEDFYLLQKLRKSGDIIRCLEQNVYPSSRISDRVPFGTGPAMQSGIRGDWDKYPIFSLESFRKIGAFYDLLPDLFSRQTASPPDDFFVSRFGTSNIWENIRQNSTTVEQFIKKAHQKFDGLRILQFLRYDHRKTLQSDEQNLQTYLSLLPERERDAFEQLSFQDSPVSLLDKLRNDLFEYEKKLRCQTPNSL